MLSYIMSFYIKSLHHNLYRKINEYLIYLGDICLMKENSIYKKSYCSQFEKRFDYHGIRKALCGKTFENWSGFFTPKRILVIQMK